jgi:hypothetical protein
MHIPFIYQVDYTEIAELFNLLKQTLPLNLKKVPIIGLPCTLWFVQYKTFFKEIVHLINFCIKVLRTSRTKNIKERYKIGKKNKVAYVLTKAFHCYAFQIWLDGPFHKLLGLRRMTNSGELKNISSVSV